MRTLADLFGDTEDRCRGVCVNDIAAVLKALRNFYYDSARCLNLVINRSTTRDAPTDPMAPSKVALLFGTPVAETVLASVHVRTHRQAGHMDASDLIKMLPNTLQGGGRPHIGLGQFLRTGVANQL
jgi:hypothetical protein